MGMKILIIDDDIHICETLKDILEEDGHRITTVNDGETAVSIVQKDPPDVIFLDMRLNTMNGLETYLATRKIDPKITVVLMTAYQRELKSCVDEALRNGAYTCVYKPFQPKEILEILKEIIHKRKK